MSAPAFGSVGTAEQSTGTNHNYPVPASVASGDIIVVAIFTDVSTTTLSTLPSGFAHAENSPRTVNAGGGGNHSLNVVWKRATGADSGTYNFVVSASVFVEGNATRYTGCVASGNPWDSPTNAADGGASTSTTTPNVSINTQGSDRMLVLAGTNWGGGAWTPASGWNERVDNSNSLTVNDLVQAAQGSTGNVHATNASTSETGAWLGALIGTTVDSVLPPLVRYPQYRDYSEAQWAQRDRRDANTVATAANPLVAPLDSEFGRYWHLYNDTATRDRRFIPQQRNYVSDPSMLTPPATDPLTVAAGVGGDTWRRYNLPDYADRREVPQQREYESAPGLLDSALLENEMLGGAETPKRYFLASTHVDRREVPQQRAYVSDPSLLTTAELENELLGGAETSKRMNVPVTHAPRWWMPEQPLRQTLYFDAGPDVPPLTLAWGDGGGYWARYNQAGWQPDRREVPQQRAYISDPSFYPTIPPTDPLTVAWGVGGTYWLIYNSAVLYVDRREAPQQRRYVSDPATLASALLENELLGGADDRWRRLQALADRREVPQQRAYVSDPTLFSVVTDPLTLAAGIGGDTWRRYNTPAYADRREVTQQPLRATLYFDGGPDSPPLTLAWGAGGDNWHRYQWRRAARSWWPPRLWFMPLGDPCTITRPTTGTTLRPGSGATLRPSTGITQNTC